MLFVVILISYTAIKIARYLYGSITIISLRLSQVFLVESSVLELAASAGYPKHYSGDEDRWIVQLWHTLELWRNFVQNQTTS